MGLNTSFVEVNDEPLHQEIYKNDCIRMYRTILYPGICTDFHRHSQNTVYIILKGGRISSEKMKGTPYCPTVLTKRLSLAERLSLLFQKIFHDSLNLPDGFIFYMPGKENTVIHRARASELNNHYMDLLGIEVLYSNTDKYREMEDYEKTAIETEDFVASQINIEPNQVLDGEKIRKNGVVVVISGRVVITGDGNSISLSTGDYYWTGDDPVHSIDNKESEQVKILYVLLKE